MKVNTGTRGILFLLFTQPLHLATEGEVKRQLTSVGYLSILISLNRYLPTDYYDMIIFYLYIGTKYFFDDKNDAVTDFILWFHPETKE